MIDIALTRRHAHEAHAPSETTPANGILGRVARWMKIRHDRRLLQSMPDYLLSDIGISRGEIEHATAFGRPQI